MSNSDAESILNDVTEDTESEEREDNTKYGHLIDNRGSLE